MNFNKTTEYTLQILNFMVNGGKEMYSANELNSALKIPYRYLRKQLTVLTSYGILNSIQGPKGGYSIKGILEDISLYDVIKATERENEENECFFGIKECPMDNKCVMHEKWSDAKMSINKVLKSTTINDIIRK